MWNDTNAFGLKAEPMKMTTDSFPWHIKIAF
jgi:hypothetical protein